MHSLDYAGAHSQVFEQSILSSRCLRAYKGMSSTQGGSTARWPSTEASTMRSMARLPRSLAHARYFLPWMNRIWHPKNRHQRQHALRCTAHKLTLANKGLPATHNHLQMHIKALPAVHTHIGTLRTASDLSTRAAWRP